MAKDANTVAQLWSNRLAASTPEMTAGVRAVATAPGIAAAQKADVWLAKLQASRAKWVRNTSAVTLAEWQQSMIDKGIPRVATGANAAIPKMTKFMTAFLPYVEQGAQTVRAMPNATLEDGVQRAAAMIRHNAAFPGYR